MASAVYSDSPASRLSISLEGEVSASPFPSPSSSFLPPPTVGAHEFAVKPVPAARVGRKLSATAHMAPASSPTSSTVNGDAAAAATPTGTAPHTGSETTSQRLSANGVQGPAVAVNGQPQPPIVSPSENPSPSPSSSADATISTTKERSASDAGLPPPSPSLLSPTTPTPYTLQHNTGSSSTLEPPRSPGMDGSTSSSTTPTIQTLALPPEDTLIPTSADPALPTTPTTATTKAQTRLREEDEYPSKIIIPSNLDAGLTSLNGASAPSSPAFSTFSNTSRSRPLSTTFASAEPTSSTSASSPSLFSNRPAPPSPAVSRRVSAVPSLSGASTRSRSSRPPSQVISRTNSLRKSTSGVGRGSPVIQPHRLSQSFAMSSPLPSPLSPAFAMNISGPGPSASQQAQHQPEASTSTVAAASIPEAVIPPTRSVIKVRDFGYPASDERHRGLGPDVPRQNKVARLNRRLGAPHTHVSGSSATSSDGEGDDGLEDEEEEEADEGGGWGSSSVFGTLRWMAARAGVYADGGYAAGGAGDVGDSDFPSRSDLDMNFRTDDEDLEYEDADDVIPNANGVQEEYEEEDTLYPGLYRALYAFEPEGTAEMRLVEDQVVRVVGRGGGVGWAVVVDESSSSTGAGAAGGEVQEDDQVRHALVPESYLEPVRLDWEDEEAAAAAGGGVEVPPQA